IFFILYTRSPAMTRTLTIPLGKPVATMRRMIKAFMLVIPMFAAVEASALVKFDFEQKFFVEFGQIIKDHGLIRADGVYHLFYLRGDPAVNIGHATSPDLIHWTQEDPVLSIQPGTWDDQAMWAPQVLPTGRGDYIMYYTGVNLAASQQAGIALSADLYNWIKLPWPVYHPDPLTWAEWSLTAFSHGRDPYVFEYQGSFYMINTAKTWFNKGAVAFAISPDMLNWTDIGPLYVHDTWHVLESLQCVERNDKFHMFFTEETIAGTSHMASDSLFNGWDIGTRSIIDFGHAPEVTPFDGNYVFSRHAAHQWGDGSNQFVIRFDTLIWFGDDPVVYKPWPLAADWNTTSGFAFITQPTFLNNPAVRGDSVDVGFEGMSWISSFENYGGPLGPGSSGSFLGDGAVGSIQSRTFTIVGHSMNLLVGGGDYPADCYVALVDTNTQEVLFTETGRNTDAMDRRYWDLTPYRGRDVYIEIMDNSVAPFGHINVDDIQESFERLDTGGSGGKGDRFTWPMMQFNTPAARGEAELFPNSPNPFNPVTDVSYYLPAAGRVAIEFFDVRGKRVRRLEPGREGPGMHTVRWNGTNDRAEPLSSGIYFYRLVVDGRNIATRKMMLLK
ncbi:MAG: FlgD immunoglobulin-like domain containing protein, partial [Candidatus Krumholzibacteria bacterium]